MLYFKQFLTKERERENMQKNKAENVNRENLLRQLHVVSPGLSRRATIDQSDCFVFHKNIIYTFNDQVACRISTDVQFTKAIPSAPLLSALENIADENVTLTLKNHKLIIRGKNTTTQITTPPKIKLPVKTVPRPSKWKRLPEEFSAALRLIQPCASSNVSEFVGTCVHFTKNYMQACDGFIMGRYTLDLPIKEDILMLNESVQFLLREEPTHFSNKGEWSHFKTTSGLRLSCRRYLDEFPPIAHHLESSGQRVILKKGMASAAERASLFLDDIKEGSLEIKIEDNVMSIGSVGVQSEHKTRLGIGYDGPPLAFLIPPAVLIRIADEHAEFRVDNNKVNINEGPFQFCATLSRGAK